MAETFIDHFNPKQTIQHKVNWIDYHIVKHKASFFFQGEGGLGFVAYATKGKYYFPVKQEHATEWKWKTIYYLWSTLILSG